MRGVGAKSMTPGAKGAAPAGRRGWLLAGACVLLVNMIGGQRGAAAAAAAAVAPAHVLCAHGIVRIGSSPARPALRLRGGSLSGPEEEREQDQGEAAGNPAANEPEEGREEDQPASGAVKAAPTKPVQLDPADYPKWIKEKGDFNHVIRIFNTNLPGARTVLYGLIGIKGVGRQFGAAVIKRSGIDGTKRLGELTVEEVEKLVQIIERPLDYDIPAWMLNRRKDYTSGLDLHHNTNKWDLQVRTDIERLIKMRAHRGLRHAWGYKVRGQRTKTTGRGIGKLIVKPKKGQQQKKK